MHKEPSDFELYTKYQYGARIAAPPLEEQDLSLAQLMLMISDQYKTIESETDINPGCVHIGIRKCRNNLVDIAAFAWQAVAVIDGKRGEAGWDSVRDECRELFQRKNADYGDSYKSHGAVGVVIRLSDKVRRARRLHANISFEIKSESLRDTLMDLGNYALMTLILIERESHAAA